MQENYLVYQAYGKIEVLQECIYSISSLLKVYNGKPTFRILIVTDNENFFNEFKINNLIAISLPNVQFEKWKGEINFVHRVKIEVLKFVLSKYKGNFIYADTDVHFYKEIDELFQKINVGNTIMCNKEWAINKGRNPIYKRLLNFIKSERNKTNITPETTMFNAGILGFNSSFQANLDNVLVLTDTLYKAQPIFIMEQLAFSYYLANNKILTTEGDYTYHFWNFKEFRSIINHIFNKKLSPENTLKQLQLLDIKQCREPKTKFEKYPSLLRKVLTKMGLGWKLVYPEL